MKIKILKEKIAVALPLTRAAQGHQLLRQGSGILTGIVLAKWGRGLELVGQYESLLYVLTTLSFFWVNAFGQAVLSFGSHQTTATPKTIGFNLFLIYILFSTIVLGLLVGCPRAVAMVLLGRPDWPHLALWGGYALLHLPCFFIESWYLAQDKPLHLLGYTVAAYGLYPLSIAVVLALGGGWTALIGVLYGHALLRFLWVFTQVGGFSLVKASIWRTFLSMSVPLMAYALLNGITQSLTAALIGHYYQGDAAIFALFRYGSREFPIVLALTLALSNRFVPLLAQKTVSVEALTQFRQAILKQYYWIFPLSLLLLGLSEPLFQMLFGADFVAAVPIFNIFIFLILSRALFPQTLVLALQAHRFLVVMAGIETCTIIGLALWWLPLWGLEGVAWATVVGYCVEKIGLMLYLWVKKGIYPAQYTPLRVYALGATLLAVAYVFQKYG